MTIRTLENKGGVHHFKIPKKRKEIRLQHSCNPKFQTVYIFQIVHFQIKINIPLKSQLLKIRGSSRPNFEIL